MKLIKYLFIAALMVAATAPATAKSKKNAPQRVYIFGFAASFNDTIVHFTEIQTVDSAWLSKQNTFLLGRDNYSNQLRDYLTEQKMPHRTCIVLFDRKIGRLQKKFLKMKKLYSTGKKGGATNNDIRTIAKSDFTFRAINMSVIEDGQ